MRMWYELDFDLDAFIDSMPSAANREASTGRNVEHRDDARRSTREPDWWAEDDLD